MFKRIQYDQSMAEYRNTYHCYDLATQNDYMTPLKDYLKAFNACYFLT